MLASNNTSTRNNLPYQEEYLNILPHTKYLDRSKFLNMLIMIWLCTRAITFCSMCATNLNSKGNMHHKGDQHIAAANS